jgi:hypothetical protein
VRIALLGLVAALAALALESGGAGRPPVGHLRYAIDAAAARADFSHTRDIVILQGYQAPLMRRLKARDRKLKVLLYKDLAGMAARDRRGNAMTGVATQEAKPAWYLRNTSGRRFTFRHYRTVWAADVGHRGYQRRWADNVLAEVRAQGWDGVFMDDANPTMRHHYEVARVAKYPTDASYQAATESALATIGARLRAARKLVVANFGFWKNYPDVVSPWLRHVDGAMNEHHVKVGSGYDPAPVWETQLAMIRDAEAQRKLYLGITHGHGNDRRAARYGYATALLGGSGRTHFALHADYTHETWFPEYDYEIGAPEGAATREESGVHRRAFANGLVLVNPTASSVRVEFGGAYRGSGLSGATAATMRQHTALVLTG